MNNQHRPRPRPRPRRQPNNHGANAQAPLQPPGSAVFRLLCHVDVSGGVIGSSGAIIKQLEAQTGCKIRFEEPLPGCHDRVINVIGDGAIGQKIKLTSDSGECLEVEVSGAQMGLMRVFERVAKLQRGEKECRLLAGLGQVGGVMGKGGVIIMEIQQNSGATIRILKKELTPSCAAPREELIQIVGDDMAIKKALVAVSHCLQVCVPLERKGSRLPPQTEFQDRRADSHEDYNPMPPSVSGSNCSSVGISLSEDVERKLSLNEESGQRRVVFRLLCSNGCAGGVIGKGASIVKKMQQETGACISFSSPAAGFKERVATISSLENQDSLHSSAQNAIVLVFTRCVEVGLKEGYMVGLDEGVSVNARILVTTNEINCLIDGRGRIASDISESSSVEMQLLETNYIPSCPTGSHKVVQIVGEYEKVKRALFEVTGKLRNRLFSSNATGKAGSRQQSYSTLPISSPHGKCTTKRDNSQELTLPISSPHGKCTTSKRDNSQELTLPISSPHGKCTTSKRDNSQELHFANQINDLGNVQDHKRRLPHKRFKDVRKTRNLKVNAQNLSEGPIGPTSVDTEVTMIRTIEVFIPEVSFASVYGENGDNLTRMKEISGAKVMVEDPSPGRSDGKVIISGTRESILVAQSLLQAFIRV